MVWEDANSSSRTMVEVKIIMRELPVVLGRSLSPIAGRRASSEFVRGGDETVMYKVSG